MARTKRSLSVTPMSREEWERYVFPWQRNARTYERYLASLTADRREGSWYPPSSFRRILNSAYRSRAEQIVKNWKTRRESDEDIEIPPQKRSAWWIWF